MQTLARREDYAVLLQNSPMLLVQFGAESCLPCHAIRAKLDSWCGTHASVQSVYVPIESFPDLAAGENIFAAPAVAVYIEGRLCLKESGCFSLEALFADLERYLSLLA